MTDYKVVRALARRRRAVPMIAVAVSLGVASLAIAATLLFDSRSVADSPERAVRDAVSHAESTERLPRDSTAPVEAVVNGVPIFSDDLDRLANLLQVFPVYGVDASDRRSLLEYVIDQELLRQEEARRRLVATEEQITALLRDLTDGFQRDLQAGTLPVQLANIIRGYEAAGHPLASWPGDPFVRKAYGAMITEGLLMADETRDIPASVQDRQSSTTASTDKLRARLRSQATIVRGGQNR